MKEHPTRHGSKHKIQVHTTKRNKQQQKQHRTHFPKQRETSTGESVWPSGKALGKIRICFGSPFSSKFLACGHCLVTLSLTIMKH